MDSFLLPDQPSQSRAVYLVANYWPGTGDERTALWFDVVSLSRVLNVLAVLPRNMDTTLRSGFRRKHDTGRVISDREVLFGIDVSAVHGRKSAADPGRRVESGEGLSH